MIFTGKKANVVFALESRHIVSQDVVEDLPVVEKGVEEEEVPAEPEDGASAEQAYDEHTPANQIVEGLSQEEGQTFQEFAKDTRLESFELKVDFEKCMSQQCQTLSQHCSCVSLYI